MGQDRAAKRTGGGLIGMVIVMAQNVGQRVQLQGQQADQRDQGTESPQFSSGHGAKIHEQGKTVNPGSLNLA